VSAGLELRDVFRVHSTPEGDAAALQGLSLTVREGEIVTVLGPSGSGKTTLLRILAGLDRASAGIVRVFGAELGKLSPRELSAYRERLGYADQHYARALAPELTARELVALQLGLRGARAKERRARADELLERVGLAERREAHPSELSGGEQQRVAVCAALAQRPRLFLADEPTGELDAASAAIVYELIGSLAREQGCTALIVSHDPVSATIADRIVRIRDGRVSGETVREGGDADAIVVGRGGWLRLPEELLRRVGIRSHASARVEGDRIVVVPTEGAAGPVPSERPRRIRPARRAAGRPVVELRGLEKSFGRERVLRGLDATFESGRLYAVTGPSGSGKTTLLQLLAGLDLPSAGSVEVLGRELSGLDRGARARFRREHVALVGQQAGLVPFLSARENVELGLALRGVDAEAQAAEALEAVGLGERLDQRVSRLSTGERSRVAISRAIAARPDVLLADEPTSRLDQANAVAVGALLARLARERGTTIVCATHDPVIVDQADEEVPLRAAPPGAAEPAPSTSSRNATARE
jgi:ABC-type lipoprotein export system ATPase subunit